MGLITFSFSSIYSVPFFLLLFCELERISEYGKKENVFEFCKSQGDNSVSVVCLEALHVSFFKKNLYGPLEGLKSGLRKDVLA